MGRHANFTVILDGKDRVIIRDDGPWDQHFTVTNDAEWVVKQLTPTLRGRRLLYFDSEGELDELIVQDGKFKRFGLLALDEVRRIREGLKKEQREAKEKQNPTLF